MTKKLSLFEIGRVYRMHPLPNKLNASTFDFLVLKIDSVNGLTGFSFNRTDHKKIGIPPDIIKKLSFEDVTAQYVSENLKSIMILYS